MLIYWPTALEQVRDMHGIRTWLIVVASLTVAAGPSVHAQELQLRLPSWLDEPEWIRPRAEAAVGGAVEEGESPFADHIETDRDSFTPSTRTVDRERWIVESSYSFIDNRLKAETHSFPELLMRYGLTKRIELRLGGNYEVGGAGADVSGAGGTEALERGGLVRESQLLYGLKLRVTEQDRWRPESSVILQGHTPASGPDPATAVSVGYVFGWELPDDWKLDSSLRFGADSEGHDRFEEWSPSVVLRKTLGERWNVHAEYFGHFSQNKEHEFVHHIFSPGVHYLVTPNVEIGVRLGWGLNDQSARFFSNAGLGYRF